MHLTLNHHLMLLLHPILNSITSNIYRCTVSNTSQWLITTTQAAPAATEAFNPLTNLSYLPQ